MVIAVPPQQERRLRRRPRVRATTTKRRNRIWMKSLIAIGGLAAAAVVIVQRLPDVDDLLAAARTANVGWLAIAALGYAASIMLFAEQQRRLVRAYGVAMSLGRLSGVSIVRSALAVSMPAGSAVSAAYAFGQYRQAGASRATAARALTLVAASSLLGLVVLYAGQAIIAHPDAAATWLAARTHSVLIAAVATGGAAFLARNAIRRSMDRFLGGVPFSTWTAAVCAAAGSWLAELLTLYAAVMAAHLSLGLWSVTSMFLVVHTARQLSITPGGVGVIEASLLAGLVALGGAAAPAFVAVLGYRLMSFWLVLPAGFGAWWVLKRIPPRRQPASPSRPGTSPHPCAP